MNKITKLNYILLLLLVSLIGFMFTTQSWAKEKQTFVSEGTAYILDPYANSPDELPRCVLFRVAPEGTDVALYDKLCSDLNLEQLVNTENDFNELESFSIFEDPALANAHNDLMTSDNDMEPLRIRRRHWSRPYYRRANPRFRRPFIYRPPIYAPYIPPFYDPLPPYTPGIGGFNRPCYYGFWGRDLYGRPIFYCQ